jgi:hypothetical protein
MNAARIVLYGDFTCPWSYLASRRAAVLATDGVEVDWRAVEHEPWRPRRYPDSRLDCLREELARVRMALLPGETLPVSLAGLVPYTKAAVSGYAESTGAGVADYARLVLFDAFWRHGVDLGDATTIRTLLADAIRSGCSTSDPLQRWGFAPDVTGGPVTTTAWRLIRQWAREWRGTGKEIVPVLRVDDSAPIFGHDAVDRLSAELVRRGLDGLPAPVPEAPRTRHRRELASPFWISQTGDPWLRDYQRTHREPLFSTVG